ncbi:VanZ family protein [Modestobacter sp. SYSU DS0290]
MNPTPRQPGRLALLTSCALSVSAAVAYVTLGPPGVVAGARSALMTAVEALLAPWVGTVHRAPVEAVANVLLFLPVGVLATLVLARRSRLLPLLLGAGLSGALELAQSALPGRVPDPVDLAANTAGTALGVGLAALVLTRRARAGRRRRLPAGLLTVPLLTVGLLAALTACQTTGATGSVTPGLTVAGSPPATGRPTAGALTAADGWVPDGEPLSPFADVPAITNLEPALRRAVQDAARDATAAGVAFHVSSGWRSAAYQQALFDAAVAEYGSPEAARQWVLRADESSHVTGDAVDIGPTDAMSWLSQHGSDYGLCQTYGNEMWHFELAVERGGQCPAPAADPTAG